MALTPGARLGAHEISSSLGSGGMGEVFRARDTRLNREVALKVLPDAFLADPDHLARFKREAQVLASLNHPNIATIYGFEEADGIQALVLELVDGPTLADRIAQGPLPLRQVLPIARQVADALDAAHEQGIIHRDLKPANIKLRADDTVKVLDFGLAKMIDVAGSSGSGRPGGSGGPGGLDITNSPTLTGPAMTRAGVILGTATYMSPEQARGANVDARTDIWAFECVLLRDAGRPAGVSRGHDVGCHCRDPRARAAMGSLAGRDTRASSTPAAPMSRERLETQASPQF
jgi:eukaryotic-like serine/threonine-protein kinase